MKKIFKQLISLVIMLSLILGLTNVSIFAEEVATPKIPLLSLGDSIATGYALSHYDPLDLTKATESYINLLGVSMGITPVNLGIDGLTSAGLLKLFEETQVKEKLAASEVITISIGGNNVLKPMIAAIKTEFGLSQTADNDELGSKLAEVGLMPALSKVQTALTAAAPAIDQGVKDFETEFPKILSQLKEIAPDARILVSTLYNAYGGVKVSGLDFNAATQGPIEALNAIITKNQVVNNFEIVDVAKAFGATPIVNKLVNVNYNPLNLDPHPAAAGHEMIFDLYAKLLIKGFTSFRFTDISMNAAKNSVRYLAGMGIVSGNNNLYQPDGQLTRGQFVKILKGAVGGVSFKTLPVTNFVDVLNDKWYAPYVTWAVENGITNGNAKKEFGPNDNITRQDLAVMLYRLVEISGYSVPTIPTNELYSDDTKMAGYAKKSIYALKVSGFLVEKTGEAFNPTAQATRGEAAMILAHFVKAFRDK